MNHDDILSGNNFWSASNLNFSMSLIYLNPQVSFWTRKWVCTSPRRWRTPRSLSPTPPWTDTDKIKVFGSRVKVDNVSKVAEIELAEKEKMKDKVVNFEIPNFSLYDQNNFQVDLICAHDMNVFINRQLIYNYPEQLFADRWMSDSGWTINIILLLIYSYWHLAWWTLHWILFLVFCKQWLIVRLNSYLTKLNTV